MPLKRLSAEDAFANHRDNPFGLWPRRDEPNNRFAHFADPQFEPRFLLEPGQRIFTIGSCFARNVERSLERAGFDIPTLKLTLDRDDWGGDPLAVLNNYVPPSIIPQIRWAFGLDTYDPEIHAVEHGRGRYFDLQLSIGFRALPLPGLLDRRSRIDAIYRQLATSDAVIVTLGLIEAWFDTRSGLHINAAPPKSVLRSAPGRFELHVLDYEDVIASLEALVALLGQVCPAGHRIVLTVSPVPLNATFTSADVAVANTYSKSVLRAATEAIVARHEHIAYFPSYESITLTDRSLAFVDDQIHVDPTLVAFNVERMVKHYVRNAATSPQERVAQAKADIKSGRFRGALKDMQEAWALAPDDPVLTLALAEMQQRAGNSAIAVELLHKVLAQEDNVDAHGWLARIYNAIGRHEEAAHHSERAVALGRPALVVSIQRAIAYYELGRYEEGLAVLDTLRYALDRKPYVTYWKARFCQALRRWTEAEEHYRSCNGMAQDVSYSVAYAGFLVERRRFDEARPRIDAVLKVQPNHQEAAALRNRIRQIERGDAPPAPLAPGQRALLEGDAIAPASPIARIRDVAARLFGRFG